MKIVTLWTQPLNSGDAAILYAQRFLLNNAFAENQQIEHFFHAQDAESSTKYFPDFNFSQNIFNCRKKNKNRYFRKIFNPIHRALLFYGRIGYKLSVPEFTNFLLQDSEKKGIEEIYSSDLVVSTGGTYLMPYYNIEAQIHDYEVTMSAGVPLLFFTQSLGPFLDKNIRVKMQKVFNYAFLILVRDEKSRRHLLDLNIADNKIVVVPDAAFALPKSQKDTSNQQNPLLYTASSLKQSINIAISVREWSHFHSLGKSEGHNNYIKSIEALIKKLCNYYNANITFVSTCQGRPEYRYEDSVVANSIVEKLPNNLKQRVRVDSQSRNPLNLQDYLAKFNLVIATRMHMAILALNAGVPVIPIAYEFKTTELFNKLGMGSYVLDIEKINPNLVIKCLESFLCDLPNKYRYWMENVEKTQEECLLTSKIVRKAYDKIK